MKKPNRTQRVMDGLITLADAIDERGPLVVFADGVQTDEEEHQWRGVARAKEWIRAWQRYDLAREDPEALDATCVGDT